MLQIVFAEYLSEVEKHIAQFLGENYLKLVVQGKLNLFQKVNLIDLNDLSNFAQETSLFELSATDSLPRLFVLPQKNSLIKSELEFLLGASTEMEGNNWIYFPNLDLKADLKKELTQKQLDFIVAEELSNSDKKTLASDYVKLSYPEYKQKLGQNLIAYLQTKRIPQEIFDFIDLLVLAEIEDWNNYAAKYLKDEVNLFRLSLTPESVDASLPDLLSKTEIIEENQLLMTALFSKLNKQGQKQALNRLILTDYHNKIILKVSSATWLKKWLFDLVLDWKSSK
ncbi:MAG: hypothetical protein OHK0017_05910 [Patescibacteria group bacterium]